MQIEQRSWTQASGWVPGARGPTAAAAQVVLAFGATEVLKQAQLLHTLRADYPQAIVMGCSTAGEIFGTQVLDDSLVVTAIHFERTPVRHTAVHLGPFKDSFQAGQDLGKNLPDSVTTGPSGTVERLVHVLVLSDGLDVNGSDLVAGLAAALPTGVSITGGMAGDGARFGETLVFRDGEPQRGAIAALGLYGNHLKVGYGSLGGWDSFGPERLITRSQGNVLFELDGQSALGLYKKYLGEHAADLPASGLLFPLSLRTKAGETPVVRTLLAVDEVEQSVTFAGDVPVGAYARLMKANFDRLIDGATHAAQTSRTPLGPTTTGLALLISCVGRKLVLKQRVEEEVEAVRDVLGDQAVLAGFYSYGEISPFTPGARCELHNQTMTITTLSEEP